MNFSFPHYPQVSPQGKPGKTTGKPVEIPGKPGLLQGLGESSTPCCGKNQSKKDEWKMWKTTWAIQKVNIMLQRYFVSMGVSFGLANWRINRSHLTRKA